MAEALTTESPSWPSATALVVEDSSALRRATAALLRESGLFGEVLTASDGFEGLNLLRARPIDIVLCDLFMPRCDGMQLLRARQEGAFSEDVPVIVLTGDHEPAHLVMALELGARDYITKPFHSAELHARVGVHLQLKRATDQLRRKSEALARATRTDALTGVANRLHLQESLSQEFERARRYRRALGVVMIDLDHFKRINDGHGHLAGDHALQHAAGAFSRQTRQSDVFGRYGGEEFLLILPETPLRGAVAVAERLRMALAGSSMTWGERTLRLTASFGVAALPMQSVGAPMDLLALADEALYRAKREGRNRVGMPPPGSSRTAPEIDDADGARAP